MLLLLHAKIRFVLLFFSRRDTTKGLHSSSSCKIDNWRRRHSQVPIISAENLTKIIIICGISLYFRIEVTRRSDCDHAQCFSRTNCSHIVICDLHLNSQKHTFPADSSLSSFRTLILSRITSGLRSNFVQFQDTNGIVNRVSNSKHSNDWVIPIPYLWVDFLSCVQRPISWTRCTAYFARSRNRNVGQVICKLQHFFS